MLITSENFANKHGLKIRASIEGRAVAGVNWKMFGSGPVPATKKALEKTGLSIDDIDALELNEAFAAQALYCIKKANWNPDKVNLNGSAPNFSINSRGSMTLPFDFDIFCPNLSLTRACI